MVRISVVFLVLLLAGCAQSLGYHFTAWQRLDNDASVGPGDAWIDSHSTTAHMQCFPFYCHN